MARLCVYLMVLSDSKRVCSMLMRKARSSLLSTDTVAFGKGSDSLEPYLGESAASRLILCCASVLCWCCSYMSFLSRWKLFDSLSAFKSYSYFCRTILTSLSLSNLRYSRSVSSIILRELAIATRELVSEVTLSLGEAARMRKDLPETGLLGWLRCCLYSIFRLLYRLVSSRISF